MFIGTGFFGTVFAVSGGMEFELWCSGYDLEGSMRTSAVGRADFEVSICSKNAM